MHYNFAADNCSRFSSREARFYAENGRFAFFSPPLEGLEATYYDYLRLTEKCAVDLILVLIERFSLGVTADALRVNIGSKPGITFRRGLVDPKFQVKMVAPPTTLLLRKQSKIILWYKNVDRSFFRFVTMHAFDRQTDRQTNGRTESFVIARLRNFHFSPPSLSSASSSSSRSSSFSITITWNFVIYFHQSITDLC